MQKTNKFSRILFCELLVLPIYLALVELGLYCSLHSLKPASLSPAAGRNAPGGQRYCGIEDEIIVDIVGFQTFLGL